MLRVLGGWSYVFHGVASAAPFFISTMMEGNTMNFYRDLYYKLFSVIADAVESLENNEPLAAKKALIAAMREAEKIVISAESE